MEQSFHTLKDPVFKELEKRAKVGALSEDERMAYDHSLKVYRDNLAIIRYERSEGKAEGRAEGHAEGLAEGMERGLMKAAKNMAAKGLSKEIIFETTGIRLD